MWCGVVWCGVVWGGVEWRGAEGSGVEGCCVVWVVKKNSRADETGLEREDCHLSGKKKI